MTETATDVGRTAPLYAKSPVAFRVPRANDDGLTLSKTEWRYFTDEAEASREADALSADYQGLYVRDGTPIESRPGEIAIEAIAKWLHDETEHPESYIGHTWPETDRDDGQREGGFVKIVPLHAQAYFRDIARRLVARFPIPVHTTLASARTRTATGESGAEDHSIQKAGIDAEQSVTKPSPAWREDLETSLRAWDAYDANCTPEKIVEQANSMAKAIRSALGGAS